MRVLPRSLSRPIEEESKRWYLRCPVCDFETSVWDAGGIRYKAASAGKRVGVRCPQCKQMRMMSLEYRDV